MQVHASQVTIQILVSCLLSPVALADQDSPNVTSFVSFRTPFRTVEILVRPFKGGASTTSPRVAADSFQGTFLVRISTSNRR